jgi:hypothetical protein
MPKKAARSSWKRSVRCQISPNMAWMAGVAAELKKHRAMYRLATESK